MAATSGYGDTENVKSAKGVKSVKSVKATPKDSDTTTAAHSRRTAPASPPMISIGNSGIRSGNQINSVAQAPVEISGNAVGVVGDAQASSIGGAWANC